MVETTWPEIGGKQVRYRDDTWELTGSVDVHEDGRLLAVDARQTDDVRHVGATLFFAVANPPDSLNPGDLGDHFDNLAVDEGAYHLVVKTEGRTYRYVLQRIVYD